MADPERHTRDHCGTGQIPSAEDSAEQEPSKHQLLDKADAHHETDDQQHSCWIQILPPTLGILQQDDREQGKIQERLREVAAPEGSKTVVAEPAVVTQIKDQHD